MFEKLFLAVAIIFCLNFLLVGLPVEDNTIGDFNSLSVETQMRFVDLLPQHQGLIRLRGI